MMQGKDMEVIQKMLGQDVTYEALNLKLNSSGCLHTITEPTEPYHIAVGSVYIVLQRIRRCQSKEQVQSTVVINAKQ